MSYTLGQASRATKKSKTTIARAIQAGKLSAAKDVHGQWCIDPAELHRVYPPATENPAGGEAVVGRVVVLEEQLAAVRQALEDVRVDRDHWRALAEREISERRPARRGLLGWFR